MNLRPSGPKPDALPGCATPRLISFIDYMRLVGNKKDKAMLRFVNICRPLWVPIGFLEMGLKNSGLKFWVPDGFLEMIPRASAYDGNCFH